MASCCIPFSPVRRLDFWGICFEADNYNLWVKSGDVGILCYEYDGETWQYNPDAVMPDYIEQESCHEKTTSAPEAQRR